MTIDRRQFLAASAAVLAAPSIGLAATRKLKLSHYLPPQHQTHLDLVHWTDNLRAKTNGELDIEIFPAGQMGPAPRQFDLVRTGLADMAFVLPSLSAGRFPLSDLFMAPFLFSKGENLTPLTDSACSVIVTRQLPALAEEYAGTRLLCGICTRITGFFMRDKRIAAPDDLRGLRIRPNGQFAAAHLTAWGASPATVSPAEVADAIGKGVIDGALFNYEGGKSFQLGETVREVSDLNHSSGFFALVMNEKSYRALPEAHRSLIDETTGVEAAARIGAAYDQATAVGRQYMLDQGATIHAIPPEIAHAFKAPLDPITEAYVKTLEAKGLKARQLLASVTETVQQAG
ncbi:TRAP transporter substrate-binding protein [Chelatococcus sp. GCM10030263]|uniref:TRAP transporter substrate-binding protein n=1 Tax=Chelatococcus sp. GCM10030263 TaxID=3273387 RepID=UPI00360AE23E